MLEVFLFINPLGQLCLNAEQALLEISQNTDKKIHLRFIPVLNLQIVATYMQNHHLDPRNLALRNQLFTDAFQAILAYKAAEYQGAKRARQFLIDLQRAITDTEPVFSNDLLLKCAAAAKLDLTAFEQDRHSQAVVDAFDEDQKMICQFAVRVAPTLIVYDYSKASIEPGLLVENVTSYTLLSDICLGEYSANHLLNTHPNLKPNNLHVLSN